MLYTENHIFLINFHFSARKGEVIAATTHESLNQLSSLIQTKRRNHSFTGMDVYELEGTKWKKITIKKFRSITGFHTELEITLNEIYG